MKNHCKWALVLAVALLATAAQAQEDVTAARADGAATPLRVFAPDDSRGCPPLALISPGAGGNETDYSYLARALSHDGWEAVVMGHAESGRAALRRDIWSSGLRRGLLKLTTDPDAYRGRFMDIAATLKWADGRCHAPFKALVGHSMGAATVMLEAGALNKVGAQGGDRFDAYVALSPQGPGSIFPDNAWRGIRKPMLIMTGTSDDALEGSWKARTVPYDDMPGGCKWLGVIDGASHLNFAGIGFSGTTETLTTQTMLAFLDSLSRQQRCGAVPRLDGLSMSAK